MRRKQTSAEIVIRPMRRKDSAIVTRMLNQLADSGNKLKANFLVKNTLGSASSNYTLVAVAGSNVIGFSMVFDRVNFNLNHIDSTLSYLFVDEAWRGMGVGRKLAAQAAADAMKRGCVWFRTETAPWNKKAQKLYHTLGFSQRDYRPVQYLMEGKTLRQFTKEKF